MDLTFENGTWTDRERRATVLCLSAAVAALTWSAGAAWGAKPDAMNMEKLVQIMRNFINISKVVMALLSAIYGTWLFVLMKMGNEGVKKSTIEFLSSTFFAFGATIIVDALLAVTVGKIVFKSGG